MCSSPYAAAPPAATATAREPTARWPTAATPGAETVDLLGGAPLIRQAPQSRAEIHGALVRGLPYAVLLHLVDQMSVLGVDDLAAALGLSTRTLRRQREQPDKAMPPDLASKTWLIAETLAQAVAVFGGREAAERWLARPAMALDGARPIELLRTLQGAELVSDLLGRLAHGVYN